jgi:hypothetical protein
MPPKRTPKPPRPTPDQNGLFDIPTDIRLMSRRQLAAWFASESNRIMVRPLIRNLVWQARNRIAAGTEPPVSGNLRTFWYSHVKPTLAHFADDDTLNTDPYNVMLDVFTELVLERKVMKYADFDFADEGRQNRRLGTTRADVLTFSEKTGWLRFLKAAGDAWGVTVAALGGMPSALSAEYLARDLRAVTSAPIRLIGIVDYDPAGSIIAEAFRSQLEAVGLAVAGLETLVHPRHYAPDELKLFKFSLPKGEPAKTAAWLARTGGIDGKPFGLEAESMPLLKARNLLSELVLSPI